MSRNAFSLNFPLLKSQAKQRLKAVRSGDRQQLKSLLDQHPRGDTLSQETIQLADVQLVIAREHGLKTWAEIKQHADHLAKHHHAIKSYAPAPDAELRTLHVRCGHDIQATLQSAGFIGDFLPFIDPFCMGPLHRELDVMNQSRAEFVCDELLSIMGNHEADPQSVIDDNAHKLVQLNDRNYQRIVFWVEHDNYDQVMLYFLLTHFCPQAHQSIEFIEINRYPGKYRFLGLGQLPAEALRALWQQRQVIGSAHHVQANQLWQAFCASSPQDLVALYHGNEVNLFTNAKAVIHRHLQELPHENTGLGFTQCQTLRYLKTLSSPVSVGVLFSHFNLEIDPLCYLGDVMYWALIKSMTQGSTPLCSITDDSKGGEWYQQQVVLTEAGQDYLTEVRLPRVSYWVGGVEVTPETHWRWDHINLDTLASC